MDDRHRGVIRTQSGDHKFYVPGAFVKQKKELQRSLLKALQDNITGLTLHVARNFGVHQELSRIAVQTRAEARRCKIGVLYVKEHQTTEEEILSNGTLLYINTSVL